LIKPKLTFELKNAQILMPRKYSHTTYHKSLSTKKSIHQSNTNYPHNIHNLLHITNLSSLEKLKKEDFGMMNLSGDRQVLNFELIRIKNLN